MPWAGMGLKGGGVLLPHQPSIQVGWPCLQRNLCRPLQTTWRTGCSCDYLAAVAQTLSIPEGGFACLLAGRIPDATATGGPTTPWILPCITLAVTALCTAVSSIHACVLSHVHHSHVCAPGLLVTVPPAPAHRVLFGRLHSCANPRQTIALWRCAARRYTNEQAPALNPYGLASQRRLTWLAAPNSTALHFDTSQCLLAKSRRLHRSE